MRVCPSPARWYRHWCRKGTSGREWDRCLRTLVTLGTCAVAVVSPAVALFADDETLTPFERGRLSIVARDARQHATTLASDTFEGRHTGSRGGHAASIYIAQHLRKCQLASAVSATTYFQEFGNESRNILALIPGSDPRLKDEYILIGAHYDHVGYGNNQTSNGPVGFIHNGADDNASGVSTVLEIAEAWQVSGERPARSLIFAFWDGEEHGLLGSRHWVAQPTAPLANLRCIINMDMVGRLKGDAPVEVTGVRTMVGLRRRLSEQNREAKLRFNYAWIVEDNSDHWPFFERRIPFVMPFTGFHDDYHRPSDDVDKLNFEGLQSIARWMYGVSRDLANAPDLPRFREAALQETNSQRQAEATLPRSEPRLPLELAPADNGPGRQIARVYPQTTPEIVGLRSGDRITRFGDQDVTPQTNLMGLILRSPSPVKVQFRRDGVAETLQVRIPLAGKPIRIGINWREDAAEPGVVAINLLEPGSPADDAGLKVNDRIQLVNGQSFSSSAQCRELLLGATSPVNLQIERDGQVRELSLTIPPDETEQDAETDR